MAIFDKKLRSIANNIKDNYIKKYVLEYFLNFWVNPAYKKNFYIKKTKSLELTKNYFNESRSLSGIELKEFSLIYLVINNLDLMQQNIYMIENIKLFTEINKQIFEKTLDKLKTGEELSIDKLDIDKQLIDKPTTSMYPSTKKMLLSLLDNFLAISKL